MFILIVDDDADIANMIASNFDLSGHKTVTAYGGFDAIEVLKAQTPDVVFLDMMMPRGSGGEVLAWFNTQEKRTQVRVILMSAHPALAEEAKRLQANAFLAKPFELRTLETLLTGA